MILLLQWVLSAIAMLIVANFVPGYFVLDIQSAAIAAVAIGLLNAIIGSLLRMISLPQGTVMLGISLLISNSLAIMMAPALIPGFRVTGFLPAFWGAVIMSALGMAIKEAVRDS